MFTNLRTEIGQPQNPGTGNDQFNCPTGVTINTLNGDIVIADTCNQRVQVFKSDLSYKGTLGAPEEGGNDNQHFSRPMGVAVDAGGYIYVADNENFRVQKCSLGTSSFTCTTFAGETGVFDDGFGHINPTSVAIDQAGRVFVADEWNSRVQIYDANGVYLTTIGGQGDERSNNSRAPLGVAVDNAGNLYTADAWNHRVQKFALGVPGWRQANINGFGSRQVDQLPSMEVFNNKLYVGASNYAEGVHHVFSTSNAKDWQEGAHDFQDGVSTLKTFSNQLYAGTWGGLIWKSPDGANWTHVFTLPEGGLASMSEFNGALYAGTYCGDPAIGASIYESTDGDNWTPFVTGGNGDVNVCGVISAATFKGNHYFGAADWTGATGARIWRTDGATLSVVVDNGFNNPENYAPGGLEAFEDWLYVSVHNPNSYQVWRSSSGDSGSWSKIFETGMGQPGIGGHTGLIVFEDQLYLATYNNWSGMQVWRTSDGVNWFQVGVDGFGDSNNERTEWSNSIAEFNHRLFFGATNYANGGEVWQMMQQIFLPVINN